MKNSTAGSGLLSESKVDSLKSSRVIGKFQCSFDRETQAWLETTIQQHDAYFEFGMGWSTVMVSQFASIPIFSVETDPDYLNRVKSAISERLSRQEQETRLYHADIGPVGRWGYSQDQSSKYHLSYLLSVQKFLSIHLPAFQSPLVLVDGRYRVLSALLANQLMNSGVILVDDYEGRSHYKILEDYLVPLASVGRARAFQAESVAYLDFADRVANYYRDQR